MSVVWRGSMSDGLSVVLVQGHTVYMQLLGYSGLQPAVEHRFTIDLGVGECVCVKKKKNSIGLWCVFC